MAVTALMDEVKVVIKFVKGSQTIGHCNKAATDENLYALGQAIGSLNKEEINEITKVVETKLLNQA
nr:hypothetical protein [uncultured Niameybacter sp.]